MLATTQKSSPGVPQLVLSLERDGASPAVARGLILLVEDDFMLRGALAETLHAEGYKVESAANGLDALRPRHQPPKPSLILLDIMLPYVDGLEFRALQRMARETADIPVIVITAVGLRPEIADELDLRGGVVKPLDIVRVLAAIKERAPTKGS